MTQDEHIPIQELSPPNRSIVGGQHQVNEQNVSSLDQADLRQWDSYKRRACVLAGSAILQLPIWGTLRIYRLYILIAEQVLP